MNARAAAWTRIAGMPPWAATNPRSRAADVALRLAAAAASAALWALGFAPADLGVLAWVALAPLLWACDGVQARQAAALGFAFGILSSLAVFGWIADVPAIGPLHVALLASLLALYPAAWCALLPRLAASRVPLLVSAPASWVVLEWLRGHAGFLALPWATAAHTQHANLPLLQLAAWTGEAGIAALVVATNVALAQWAARRQRAPLWHMAALLGAVHLAGALALAAPAPNAPALRVAALQPALPIGIDDALAWQRLQALTREAGDAGAALVVWPETSVRADDASLRALAALARQSTAMLVVGAAQSGKFDPDPSSRGLRNSALAIAADGTPAAPYHKRRLVPFAEATPLPGVLPWPRWLVPGTRAVQPGTRAVQWTLPQGWRIAPLICWENLHAALAREAVEGGAQLLVQLSDDAWFGRSAAARQHAVASVLRAVENRVPVLMATNGGAAQLIDARGRVRRADANADAAGVLVASVQPGDGPTFYTRHGDVSCALAAALSALALVARARPARRHWK